MSFNDSFEDFVDHLIPPMVKNFTIENMEGKILQEEEEKPPKTSTWKKVLKTLFGKKPLKQYRPPSSKEKEKLFYEGF